MASQYKRYSYQRIFQLFYKRILTEAEDFFRALSNDISKFKIEETGWNPNPKEGEYAPTFIPQILSDKIKNITSMKLKVVHMQIWKGKKVTAEIVDHLLER